MTDLLLQRTAVINLIYRYELRRVWDDRLPLLVVCMLNPSTADHLRDDPTILTLMHFARMWGFGGLLIVNLYGFRASKPAEMFAAQDPVGIDNDRYIREALDYAAAHGRHMVLVAWGNGGEKRAAAFVEEARKRQVTMVCLGTTNSGAPKHPMARGHHRIPRDQRPLIWKGAA